MAAVPCVEHFGALVMLTQPFMPWIVALLAVAATALATWGILALRRPRARGAEPLPSAWDLLSRPVFSADERRLHRQLHEALPHHIVLAKLPLVRFCQPTEPGQVRYWYDLLGATHVNFAICSVNGRVLAAIDLNYERSGSASRATRIKQSVLGACRIRYLRCAPDHLPSVPELQLLVPQTAQASRGPQPATRGGTHSARGFGGRTGSSGHHANAGAKSRQEQASTLWHETLGYRDAFFTSGGRADLGPLGDDTVQDVEPLDDTPGPRQSPSRRPHRDPPPIH